MSAGCSSHWPQSRMGLGFFNGPIGADLLPVAAFTTCTGTAMLPPLVAFVGVTEAFAGWACSGPIIIAGLAGAVVLLAFAFSHLFEGGPLPRVEGVAGAVVLLPLPEDTKLPMSLCFSRKLLRYAAASSSTSVAEWHMRHCTVAFLVGAQPDKDCAAHMRQR